MWNVQWKDVRLLGAGRLLLGRWLLRQHAG